MGLVAGQRRLRLIELCLEGAWIDLRENLPALYLLSLGEVDLLKRTRDLRADRRRIQRLHCPQSFEHDRHILALHLRGSYRHRLRNCRHRRCR